MLLAIDAGNTNIVFAVFEGDRIRGAWRASTDARRTADEYAVWFTQLIGLEGLSAADIDACILSSVVPDVVFSLRTLATRYFKTIPRIIGDASIELGVKVLMDRPEDVGADRLVNAVAARTLYGAPLIVVDFGTATTFDVIDKDGNYIGGVIAPGINLSLDALSHAAAKLPRVAIRRTQTIIGRNTVAGMQSGIFWGYIGLIEGLVGRIKAEYGMPMNVIATGGLAPLFAGATPLIEAVDLELTLTGLRLIHERNPIV